jgi:phosphatidylinositol kinase/protein kinase (PI-3  family)
MILLAVTQITVNDCIEQRKFIRIYCSLLAGTYTPDAEVVRIGSFQSSVLVLASKQRPRRLTIMGSDGKPYMFLLKGHEDLRQVG